MKKFLLIVLCSLAVFSASAQTINEKRIKELKKEIRHASRPEDSSLKNRFIKEKELRLQIRKLIKEKEYAQAESLKLKIIDLYSTDATTNSEKKVAIDDSSSKSSNFKYEAGDSLQNNVVPYRTINTYIVNRSGFYFEACNGINISDNSEEINQILGVSIGYISYVKNFTPRNRFGIITRANTEIHIPSEEVKFDVLQFGPYFTISKNDKAAFEFGLVNGLTLKPRYDFKQLEVINVTTIFRFRKKYFGVGLDIEYNLRYDEDYFYDEDNYDYYYKIDFVNNFNIGIYIGFRI